MNTQPPPREADARLIDVLCSLPTDRRRRRVVDRLSEREPPVAVEDLATEIAAREAERAPHDRQTDSPHDIVVELHHVHLPKLAAAGVVEYDVEEHVVTAVRTDRLLPLMRPPPARAERA